MGERTITLTKVRTAKNGINSYKEENRRAAGTVYLDKKLFGGAAAPETITLSAVGLVELPPAPAPRGTKAEADEDAGGQSAE